MGINPISFKPFTTIATINFWEVGRQAGGKADREKRERKKKTVKSAVSFFTPIHSIPVHPSKQQLPQVLEEVTYQKSILDP